MFLSEDTVNNQNHGILFVNWRAMINRDYFNFTCPVHVITIDPSTVSLEAWYEGPEIEVGSYYDLRHVVVYLICPGLDKIRLHFFGEGIIIGDNEVQIEDGTDSINTHLSADRNQLLILKEGNNERTVQYKYKSISLEAVYYVPGVIYKIYPDVSLKVFYITEDTREEIDMTNDFLSYFTYSGEFFISWNSFILVLKDFIEEERLDKPTHGLFRLEAPRRTGLFNKYASSWYVEVDKNLNVIAKIRKVYSDEIIIL